jgi:hypothetical protein
VCSSESTLAAYTFTPRSASSCFFSSKAANCRRQKGHQKPR